jgi:hypothetical protein
MARNLLIASGTLVTLVFSYLGLQHFFLTQDPLPPLLSLLLLFIISVFNVIPRYRQNQNER